MALPVVATVDKNGQIVIPLEFVQTVVWMNTFAEKRSDFKVVSVMDDSFTLRLEEPEEGHRLRDTAYEAASHDEEVGLFLDIRFKDVTVRHTRAYGDVPARYRFTIPSQQRQWLALRDNHRHVCIVPRPNTIEIWSMDRARTGGFKRFENFRSNT